MDFSRIEEYKLEEDIGTIQMILRQRQHVNEELNLNLDLPSMYVSI